MKQPAVIEDLNVPSLRSRFRAANALQALCFPCLPKVLCPADDVLDLAVAAISVMKMVRVRTCQLGELTGQVELHSKFEASGLEFLREDWDADFPSASLIAMTRFTAHMRNLAIALVPAAAQWCDCELFCRPRTNRTRFLVVPWLTAVHQSRLHGAGNLPLRLFQQRPERHFWAAARDWPHSKSSHQVPAVSGDPVRSRGCCL
jgi:hypothetical protein